MVSLLKKVEKRWLVKPVERDAVLVELPYVSGKCVGCRNCEIACSIVNEEICNPEFSRIRIKETALEWMLGDLDTIIEQLVCHQCPGVSPCMTVCPVSALSRDPKTGAVIRDDKKCIRCKRCIEACPYHACWYVEKLDKVISCNLCDGAPACVKACPPRILKYVRE